MNYEQIKKVVDVMENPSTDLKQIISYLLEDGYIKLSSLYDVCTKERDIVINGVTITPSDYKSYVNLIRCGQFIQAIKDCRSTYNAGLKEAKDIIDFIKDKEKIKNN